VNTVSSDDTIRARQCLSASRGEEELLLVGDVEELL